MVTVSVLAALVAPTLQAQSQGAVRPNRSAIAGFENQLADKLVSEVLTEARETHPADRRSVLEAGAERLKQDVDLQQLDPRRYRNVSLLTWLGSDHSVDATTADETRLARELSQQWQQYQSAPDANDTQQAYPSDSFAGRQAYLDQLASTLVSAEQLLVLTTSFNRYPDLSFAGGETALTAPFKYEQGVLHINLARVEALPLWEIPALALFYGFPGHHTVSDIQVPRDFRFILNLSTSHLRAYELGWSIYAFLTLPDLPMESALQQRARHWFMTLQWAGLAWQLESDKSETALADLIADVQRITPYSEHRIRAELTQNSGETTKEAFILALRLKSLSNMAIANGIERSVFNDEVLALGRVPTAFMESYLSAWISDHAHVDDP